MIFFWSTLVISMQKGTFRRERLIGCRTLPKGKIAVDIPVMHILCASIGLWIETPWLNRQSSKNSDRVWNTFAITIARHRHRYITEIARNIGIPEPNEMWNKYSTRRVRATRFVIPNEPKISIFPADRQSVETSLPPLANRPDRISQKSNTGDRRLKREQRCRSRNNDVID